MIEKETERIILSYCIVGQNEPSYYLFSLNLGNICIISHALFAFSFYKILILGMLRINNNVVNKIKNFYKVLLLKN